MNRKAPPRLGSLARRVLVLVCGFSISVPSAAEEPILSGVSARAWALHSAAILVDGHNDLPWNVRTEAQGGFSSYDIRQRRTPSERS